MDNVKYSIVIPVYNQLEYTILCWKSVCRNSQDYEVIFVDNGSDDGTAEYLESLRRKYNTVSVLRFEKNEGFSVAINAGFESSKGDYLVSLNNDTLVTPDWLDILARAIDLGPTTMQISNVGIVGPVTNYVNGLQQVPQIAATPETLDEAAINHYKKHREKWINVNFLSGFCLMLSRATYEKVGKFSEKYGYGGFEDNEYVLNAFKKGIRSVIAADCYIHHFGSRTLRPLDETCGMKNRQLFMALNKPLDDQKVVAMYRVKNGGKWFKESLNKTLEVCDEVVVLDDGSVDGSGDWAKTQSRTFVKRYERSFNEKRDRNELNRMAKERGADWVFSIDADEVLEDRVTKELIQKLCHPVYPDVFAYSFHFYTFWDDEQHWRSDGIFGRMNGPRLFKMTDDILNLTGNDLGFHMAHFIPTPLESIRVTNLRIKHYGYLDPVERQKKYEFYEEMDTTKAQELIGQEGYSHLIDTNVHKREWIEDNGLSLYLIVEDNAGELLDFLVKFAYFADEICVLCLSSDGVCANIARQFGCKVDVRPDLSIPRNLSFSDAKNVAMQMCSNRWALSLDTDEELACTSLRRVLEQLEMDVFSFTIHNLQKDGRKSICENIRLHKTVPEIYWSRRVHENFDKAIALSSHLMKASTGVVLQHYGFLKNVDHLVKKLELYKKMIVMEMNENPDDPQAYVDYALHCFEDDQREQAIEFLHRATEIDPEFSFANKELGFEYLRMSYELLNMAIGRTNTKEIEEVCKVVTSRIAEFCRPRAKVLVGKKENVKLVDRPEPSEDDNVELKAHGE